MKTRLLLLTVITMIAQAVWAYIPIPIESNYHLLDRLSIDAAKLNVMGKVLSIDESTQFYRLNSFQENGLLDVVEHTAFYTENDEKDFGFSIAAVSPKAPFPSSLMALFMVESGDGGMTKLALYDAMAKFADYIDLGYWNDIKYFNIDDTPEGEISVATSTQITFTDDDNFTIYITGEARPIDHRGKPIAKPVGTFTKEVKYTKANEKFELLGIDTNYSNDMMKKLFPFDDITNLRYMPRSTGTSKVEALNDLIGREDIAQDMADNEYSEAADKVRRTIARMLENDTQAVFTWITYAFKNDKNKQLLSIIEDCYKSQMISPGMLKMEADKAYNITIKKYMNHWFDKWDKEVQQ